MSDDSDSTQSTWITAALVVVGVMALVALVSVVKRERGPSADPSVSLETKAALNNPKPGAEAATKAEENPAPPVDEAALEPDGLRKLSELLDTPTSVPNEAVLTFGSTEALKNFLRVAKNFGLSALATLDGLNGVRIGFTDLASLNKYLNTTRGSPDAPQVEAHNWLTTPQLPKPAKSNQGGAEPLGEGYLATINATGDRTTWGRGVTVAVLDTGLKAHPTFGETQVTHLDLVQDGKVPHSHGTSVASLVAGQDDRVPGVAPGAHLLDIRVANEKGISVTSVLAQGIVEAVNRGAQVINISLGGYDDSQLLRRAVDYAWNKKVIIVAAAGNDNYDKLAFPAAIDRVISVASVDKNRKQAYFSNSGSGLDVAAPGVGLPVAWDADKLAAASGTSQSAAVVSGIVAYYLSIGVAPADIQRRLFADAKATGAPQTQVGNGVVWIRR